MLVKETENDYGSPQDIVTAADAADLTKQSGEESRCPKSARNKPTNLRDGNYSGQLLQSSKRKVPKYSARIDPTARRSLQIKRARTITENSSEGVCDNATPCQRGSC